ncbi:arabinogalactan endo-1,4-beta-galactosidase [Neolewinella xylanilytica]|uniref:Arabinogalactan endo-beta-1,4-galactanase n=1 Tax=Neolewinella xylanilytica TaxID=1514080 RepID=A0A2S6I789_9BACT|nr:glycosyl hydrolase 53 family protein [Neolewinella xylanilytica]PPK87319.1 arabinogalactan endo-1,4-beta-galactosidase [Neolewinella xylanilytica]
MRFLFLLLFPLTLSAQCLQGVDLSYVNAVEEGEGIYRDSRGERVDPYAYFAERGAEMVRLRLWHTPENNQSSCGAPISSGGMEDVLLAARRTDSAGMGIKLALHYGDYFVDPGKQRRPAAWDGLADQALLDSIYGYTYRVLERMHAQGTTPAILAVGNETDNGFVDATVPTDGFEWAADGPKFQAGIRAVAAFNTANGTAVKSAIHLTESYARYGAAELQQAGVTDYDILGISYYPHFHPETTIAEIGNLVSHLTAAYGKEVMIFETGFSFNHRSGGDDYNNFLGGNGNVVPYPATPEGQRDFLLELTRTVCDNGGAGVFYWEPGWISSEMCDAWGRGSSYENASFFDFERDNRALPAFEFLEYGTVATREAVPEGAITLYANPPVDGSLRVVSTLPIAGWRLFAADGREVDRKVGPGSDLNVTVPTASLATGGYFLQLELQDGRRVSRRVGVK